MMLDAVLGILLLTSSASPVLEHELYKVPAGRPVTVEGVRYQAFDFEEYKQILLVDKQLKEAEKQLGDYSDIATLLERIDKEWAAKEQLYKTSVSSWQDQYDRLYVDWKKLNKDYHKAKAGGIFRHFPLLIGGILSVTSALILIIN